MWFLVFSLSVFMVSIIGPSLASAGATGPDRYDHQGNTLRGAITKYHKDMNDLMNEFTKKLMEPEGDATTTPPPTMDDTDFFCGDKDNVSTLCLSYKMTEKYTDFYTAMLSDDANSHINHFQDRTTNLNKYKDSIQGFMSKYPYEAFDWFNVTPNDAEYPTSRIDAAIERQGEREELIYEQIELAEQVMIVAVDAYNELMFHYELHKAYGGILEDLEGYRDELAKVRTQVEKYPTTFHNASTTDCT